MDASRAANERDETRRQRQEGELQERRGEAAAQLAHVVAQLAQPVAPTRLADLPRGVERARGAFGKRGCPASRRDKDVLVWQQEPAPSRALAFFVGDSIQESESHGRARRGR